jgi:hypothetical protein
VEGGRAAGDRTPKVRFNGTYHDFMMLGPLRGTAPAHPESRSPMSDDDVPTPQPGMIDPDLVEEDLAALAELTAAGVELDGEVQVAETTWVIYGHTSYDGEVIAAEYHDEIEVSEVLRAIPRPHPDDTPGP